MLSRWTSSAAHDTQHDSKLLYPFTVSVSETALPKLFTRTRLTDNCTSVVTPTKHQGFKEIPISRNSQSEMDGFSNLPGTLTTTATTVIRLSLVALHWRYMIHFIWQTQGKNRHNPVAKLEGLLHLPDTAAEGKTPNT